MGGTPNSDGGRGGWSRWPFGRKADDEARLLSAARAGNPRAFDALRARHEPAIAAFCRAMLEDLADQAAGVTEETFAAARRELLVAPGQLRARPWLYGLAYERCVARLDEHRGRQGSVATPSQGEDEDQRRGAGLLMASLPSAEVATLMSLAGSRPALFGLVGELGRNAPQLLGQFAVEQAATEAITALAQQTFSGAEAQAADGMGRAAAAAPGATAADGVATAHGGRLAGSVARNADRARRAATTAAVAGSVAIVGTAGAFAIARDGGGSSSAPMVAPGGDAGASGGGGGRAPVAVGDRAGADASSSGAGGASRGDRGLDGASRNGRDGRDGRGARGGRDGGEGVRGRDGRDGRDG
ncbi:MAG TPA: hypothetical protein VD931_14315, partial [Baekduia sp.]|nr:hypothetical protein [Baekduia sp.]